MCDSLKYLGHAISSVGAARRPGHRHPGFLRCRPGTSRVRGARPECDPGHASLQTKVVKPAVEATTDEITSELQEALKEADMVDMHLEVVIIPVSDVDRAKQFYQSLGWRLDGDDSPLPGLRIVQFTPPGSAASVTFGTGLTNAAPGSAEGLSLIHI